jgi:hypothetical protein
MSEIQDLISRVLGDKSYEAHPAPHSAQLFDVYSVQLHPRTFLGVPDSWLFAVLRAAGAGVYTEEAVFQAAQDLVRQCVPDRKPLLLISLDTRVHLSDEFQESRKAVFFLDSRDIVGSGRRHVSRQLAPFVAALRRRLRAGHMSPFCSPYQRREPVTGSRFFGRERELRLLMEGDENVAVVGGRQIGKTSLLREAHRRLSELNAPAFYVDVQACSSANDVMKTILREVSPRDMYAARHVSDILGQRVFPEFLKRLSSRGEAVTLFLDELGNLFKNPEDGDWGLIGLFRKYTQGGRLRLVFSCFQELLLHRQREYKGPTVNFAATERLGTFSEDDVAQFVLGPLDTWKPIPEPDRDKLLHLTTSVVGMHPYALQAFCCALFAEIGQCASGRVIHVAQRLLGAEILRTFERPLEELFFEIESAIVRYLFLRRCHEAHTHGESLTEALIADTWVNATLRDIGYRTTYLARRNLLAALEVPGLTHAHKTVHDRQHVSAPFVYCCVAHTDTDEVQRLLTEFRADIAAEAKTWGLQAIDDREGVVRDDAV